MKRMFRFLLAVSLFGAIPLWIAWGWKMLLGFAAGSLVAGLNFFWLMRITNNFAAAIVNDANHPSGARLVFHYLTRFALITFAAFVIFKCSKASGYGYLYGLFTPVAALLCEAFYEGWVGLRHKL
jgi:ATP synthase I subunit